MVEPDREERQRNVTLCVIAPFFNEAEVIPRFYDTLRSTLDSLSCVQCEMIFVDDGSTDDTLGILNELSRSDDRVRVYSLSRNFGHQIALTAGLDVANADMYVMMDADLQHPPQLIPEMVERWREGADIVSTIRESTEKTGPVKKLTSGLFYWIMNRLSDTRIVPGATDFRLLSHRAAGALREMPERHRFLRGMVS
jgi:dolichol-phosphate mannosyltransferase